MASIRAILGLFPKTNEYEGKRNQLEDEYNELMAFKNSKELRSFQELETKVHSDEFIRKKKEIQSLRFKQTEDFQKEKNYKTLSKTSDIKRYYKTLNSSELASFQKIEKSDTLKRFFQLEKLIHSPEFAEAKRHASVSTREKFARSDLYKTLEQYKVQSKSDRIVAYFKFIGNKAYNDFIAVKAHGIDKQVEKLEKETNTTGFQQKISGLSKSEKAASPEYQKQLELKAIKKSKQFKNYLKLKRSPNLSAYTELHNTDELATYQDLSKFIASEEFKRQRKEIESKSFKDTEEYSRLQEYLSLKKSSDIQFYYKFKKSKDLANYLNLYGSDRIKDYEELQKYIQGDAFRKFKAYCLMSPRKRWMESQEYEVLQDYELQKNSDKIKWYFENIEHKRFAWHRKWAPTFAEEFSSTKLDTKKWLTRYYWGDKMLKDSYSLSQDKHFVTDGKNLHIENGRLHITTKKEDIKGKSWHPSYGFITRDFGYSSGLVNTANSFWQKYGTFEAKIKIDNEVSIQNAFWMVGKTIVPHIDIMKAAKKLSFGNSWGNPRDLSTIQRFRVAKRRGKFSGDYFIYSLEWTPQKMIWKINGLEIASSAAKIPDTEMYLSLSAGLQKDVSGVLPTQMEVDWVRCYQHNELMN